MPQQPSCTLVINCAGTRGFRGNSPVKLRMRKRRAVARPT